MQLDDYEEIKTIGKGSFGRAILVKRKQDGLLLVLKEINVMEMAPRERNDAMNEVHVLSMLDHQHIIGYFDSFLVNGILYIVMEYANAGDIHLEIKKRTIQKKYFSEDEIWIWFTQICLAVQYINSKNILHRDLKTQNIFLSKVDDCTLTVKLGDMGIAKILNSDTSFAKTVIGTPYYLSPEICEDRPYDHKSDIWSLGCVLYELATLKHAFNAGSLPALVMKILKGNYPPIPAVYSDNMKSLISFMLQTDPKKRPTVDDILNLTFLRPYIAGQTLATATVAANPSTNIPMAIIKASAKTPTKQAAGSSRQAASTAKPTKPVRPTSAISSPTGSKLNHVKLKPPVPKVTPTTPTTPSAKRTVTPVTPPKTPIFKPTPTATPTKQPDIPIPPAAPTPPLYTPPSRPTVSIQSSSSSTSSSSKGRSSSTGRLSIQPNTTTSSTSTIANTTNVTNPSSTISRRLSTSSITSTSTSSTTTSTSTSTSTTASTTSKSTLNRQTSSSSLRLSTGLSSSPIPPAATNNHSATMSGRTTPSGRITPSGRVTPSGRMTPSTAPSSSSSSNSRIISTPTTATPPSSKSTTSTSTPAPITKTNTPSSPIPIQTTPNIFNAPLYTKPVTPEIVLKKPTSGRQRIDFKQQELAYRQKLSSVKSTLQLRKDKPSLENTTSSNIVSSMSTTSTPPTTTTTNPEDTDEIDKSPSDQSEANSLENSGVESLDLNSDLRKEEDLISIDNSNNNNISGKEKRNTSPVLRDKKLETRTNALRHFCCSIFGEETFTTIYRLLKEICLNNSNNNSNTLNSNGDFTNDQQKEEKMQQQIEQLLGDKIFYLKYLQQLLYCESQLQILI